MTTLKTRKEINVITLNGRRISITRNKNHVILMVECYANKEPAIIPVYVPTFVWDEKWESQDFEYLEVHGYLASTETAPHEFEYHIAAECIYQSDLLTTRYINPTNELVCTAYLAQPPREMMEVHPYLTVLYLGTGSILENSVFSGDRFKFDLSLLRKNTELAKDLSTGDIIKIKATISNSNEHGIQLIGKQLVIVEHNKDIGETGNITPENQDNLGESFMMNFSTNLEPV